MRTFLKSCGLALVLCFSQPIAAHAVLIVPVDAGWVTFFFEGAGDPLEPFQVDALSPFTFTITDAYLSGDQFALDSLGETSVPLSTGDDIGGDFSAAVADARWSSASFILPSGSYLLTGSVKLSPYGFGAGGVRADAFQGPGPQDQDPPPIVPEPVSLACLAVGLLGLGAQRLLKPRSASRSC